MIIQIYKELEKYPKFIQDIQFENLKSARELNIDLTDQYSLITEEIPKISKETWESYLKNGYAEFEIVERTKVILTSKEYLDKVSNSLT